MSGREIESGGIGPVHVDAVASLKVTRLIADRVAAENPHELDTDMPKLAGRLAGREPDVAADLLELLGALGLPTTKRQLRALKAKAAIETAARAASRTRKESA